ncbi:MAG: DUF3786 domain-containing protein [Thermodesulfobacteriota bacterium]
MQIPQSIVQGGLEQAWSRLQTLDPEDVCRRCLAHYDSSKGEYSICSLGQQIQVQPEQRSISSNSKTGKILVQEFSQLFSLSVLWYLLQAKDADCTQRLVKPQDLPGGDMFARGSHVLPLDKLASRFGSEPGALSRIAEPLAGESLDLGDVALRLWPFPRLPAAIVLWAQDEEFPAQATLLLDSSANLHLPVDILWSTAMFSLGILLRLEQKDIQ